MERLLKISEFAALSGISRKLLIFYDKNGILHPRSINPENGYRYYSYRQLDTASVIVSFREAGMSLESIRKYLSEKSSQKLMELLSGQESELELQIKKLEQIKSMVCARLDQTKQGICANVGKIYTKDCPQENLFLGPEFPDSYELADGWDYLPAFYDACRKHGIQLGFPVGTLVNHNHLCKGKWSKPARYFYRLPEKQYPSFYTKPAGRYVIGTQFTDYGFTDTLYQQILDYINKHEMKVCGNAYEEFLIDEIAEKDANSYLLQIAVQVESGLV